MTPTYALSQLRFKHDSATIRFDKVCHMYDSSTIRVVANQRAVGGACKLTYYLQLLFYVAFKRYLLLYMNECY